MAISKNALLTAGLATFGISLALAAGPYGLAFGMALFYSSMIALAMTALIYGISEGNFKSSIHTGTTVHTKTFVPAPTPAPTVVHTQQFVPVGGVRVLPSAPPVATVIHGAKTHTRHFEPATPSVTPVVVHGAKTHTRHFEPAAPSVHHSKTFIPAANLARATAPSAAPTIHHPSVGAVSHTRTFVPRQ